MEHKLSRIGGIHDRSRSPNPHRDCRGHHRKLSPGMVDTAEAVSSIRLNSLSYMSHKVPIDRRLRETFSATSKCVCEEHGENV